MRTWLSILFALLLCGLAAAQTPSPAHQHSAPAKPKPATLMTGLGDLHHPVSTSNAQAQRFFDQGLRLIYAFNHDEAARSFQRAADLDPKLAMAYWGVAEAVGPNYNDPASDERFAAAHEAIQKAVDRSHPARRRLSKPTYRRWHCVSPPIRKLTGGRRRRRITMRCASWSRIFPTIWMPQLFSPNLA